VKVLAQSPRNVDHLRAVRELSRKLRHEFGINCVVRPKLGNRVLIQGPGAAAAFLYSATEQVTSDKRGKPFQLARGGERQG
jgi:hypothetical protein